MSAYMTKPLEMKKAKAVIKEQIRKENMNIF